MDKLCFPKGPIMMSWWRGLSFSSGLSESISSSSAGIHGSRWVIRKLDHTSCVFVSGASSDSLEREVLWAVLSALLAPLGVLVAHSKGTAVAGASTEIVSVPTAPSSEYSEISEPMKHLTPASGNFRAALRVPPGYGVLQEH